MPRRLPFLVLAALLGVVPAAHASWPNDPLHGLRVTTIAGQQLPEAMLADGSGGFFVTWLDTRPGNADVYAQHYAADGTALWTSTGVPVATGTDDQYNSKIVPDGSGGIIVGWTDITGTPSIWAQRVDATGATRWTAGGVRVASQALGQDPYAIVTDGAGGAEFAWIYATTALNKDVYAQRLSSTGARLWGTAGLATCTLTSMQDDITAQSDNAGGLWIVWRDQRNATDDLYYQRYNASGAAQTTGNGALFENFVAGDLVDLTSCSDGLGGIHVGFTLDAYGHYSIGLVHLQPSTYSNSVSVTPYITGDSRRPTLAPDPDGGVYCFWQDDRNDTSNDIYGTHVSFSGSIVPGWADQGTAVATGVGVFQTTASAIPDGEGGAIVVWSEGASGGGKLIAKRYRSEGLVAPGWASSGAPVATQFAARGVTVLAGTGTGGAFCGWGESVTSATLGYVQRIDRFGQIGEPAPRIASVRDVPNDQGGLLRVTWDASPLESGFSTTVRGYQVWRQVPAAVALRALGSGEAMLADADVAAANGRRAIRTTSDATTTLYWEYVAGVAAQGFGGYSMTIPTTGDSLQGSNPRTSVMVQAVTSFASPGPTFNQVYWSSAPDSGYSVDNLPPALPSGLAGAYNSGTGTSLTWNANAEPDLAGYHVYRGTVPGFVPSPANRVATCTQTFVTDASGNPGYYRLTAFDQHGNESPSVLFSPTGVAAAGDGVPAALAFALASPNPSRGDAVLRVDLPVTADASVTIFDAAGRRVRMLHHGALAAGSHTLRWRGEGEGAAPAGAGLYFARLETGGRVLNVRIARVR